MLLYGIMDKILIEENEIKPNLFVVGTLTVVMLALVICAVLNAVGIFHVRESSMWLAVIIVMVCTLVPWLLCFSQRLVANPVSKYIIMSSAIIEIMFIMLFLGQWADSALLMPVILAAQYHNKRMNWFALIGTLLVAFLTSYLSTMLGFTQSDFYIFLVRTCGLEVTTTPMESFEPVYWAWKNVLYIGLPRMIVVIAISTIIFTIGRSGSENLSGRIAAAHASRIDALTGLGNRFSYNETIDGYSASRPEALVCVYADADGLHAINDEKGHAAGDEFLKFCALSMSNHLGLSCFRIGGDEFVAFSEDQTEDEIQNKIREISLQLAEEGYHMSFGIETLRDEQSIDDLINSAEKKMYAAKNEYYLSTHKDRRKR